MNTIFHDANEKYLSSVVLYAKASGDTYLYEESTTKTAINRETLLNLCMKNLVLISLDGSFYPLVSFKDSGSVVTVTIATTSSSAFAVKTFTSKEAA